MSQNLITAEELIEKASLRGVTFGKGNPRVHLSYLASLGIIPSATKRKIDNIMVGCYPSTTINRLERVESLKRAGLTYSQIKIRLEAEAETDAVGTKNLKSYLSEGAHSLSKNTSTGNLIFLAIGLVLGFLVASSSLINKETALATNSSTLDGAAETMLRLIYSKNSNSSDSGPIYVINLPDQNLDRIGKTDILKLNN